MKHVNRIVLVCLLFASAAWAQGAPAEVSPVPVQFSASYLYQGSNQTPSGTNWFSSNGGRADVSIGEWRHLGAVAEFAGSRTTGLSSVQPMLLTYMAGPRRSFALGRIKNHRVSAFAQVLVGGVHASDGLFPNGVAIKSSANAFAFSSGGGVGVTVNRHLTLRLIQADYLYTQLPNAYNNYQGSFRLGTGIVFRVH
jgi:hypothetical protein